MEQIEGYAIPFRGLESGVYDYAFRLGKPLFEAFGSPEIKDGDCTADVRMERRGNSLLFEVKIVGEVTVACDRCLEDCSVGIDFEGCVEARFSDEEREYDGETLWLRPGDGEADLAQYLYESVVLSLPYQRVHPEGECDPAMMARFSIVSDEEFGAIERRASQAEPEEGRWAKLAALREKMEAEAGAEEAATEAEADESDAEAAGGTKGRIR
ncbi:MAG: DUF177 domain-containing protein [Alistipes sp.]|nr:DUF177 domain-containing protein [Alistipes sp.]